MKKKHHAPDYAKDRTADDIPKGSGPVVPQHHYEHNMDLTPEGSGIKPETCLNPMRGKIRPCTHVKTNECDH